MEYKLNSYGRYDEDRGDYMVYEVEHANGKKEYVSRNIFRKLEALKIIEKKSVVIKYIKASNSLDEYYSWCIGNYSDYDDLTQEEFNFLKKELL